MRATAKQREILAMMWNGYRLGSYFAPHGKWTLSRYSGGKFVICGRTVVSMHRRGLIAGNIHWPHVTAAGWDIARRIAGEKLT